MHWFAIDSPWQNFPLAVNNVVDAQRVFSIAARISVDHDTIYTQNFVPIYARRGPASHFSQFSELCVVTSKYVSTWVPDYPNVHVSITLLICVDLPTWGFVLVTKGVDSLCLASTPFPGLSLT